MIVGGERYKKLVANGDIVIYPFNEDQVGPNSYDIRLGNWFACTIDDYTTAYNVYTDNLERWWIYYVPDGEIAYVLPHTMILAHSYEFIGGRGDITTKLHCRSTMRRSKLDTNAAAGYGDRGYVGRWTLELKNDGEDTLIVYPGQRVAQMEFLEVDGDAGQQYQGKYGFSPELWTPMDMLPKGHLDKDKDRVLKGQYKSTDLEVDKGTWTR